MNIIFEFDKFNAYETFAGHNDVVYSYQYTVTATDGQTSASYSGFVRLDVSESGPYIPFSSLTPQIVQQWTEANVTELPKIISNLREAVLSKGSVPRTNLPAPWSNDSI